MLKNKKLTIFIFIINLLLIIISTYTNFCIVGDELWNYMNTKKVVENITYLYSEANIIITPIFPILASTLMHIFGTELIVFRFFNIIIKFGLILSMYHIYLKFNNNDKIALSLITLFNSMLFCIDNGANYNELTLLFVFIGILIYLDKSRGTLKNSILQGIAIFVIFFTKQNIGIYYIIGNIIIDFIINKDKKTAFKQLIIKGMVSAVLLIVSLIIMYKIGIVYGFWKYCFAGISTFNDNITGYADILNNIKYIIIEVAILVLISIYTYKYNIENKSDYIILLVMSVICMGYIYPLFNTYHLIIGISMSILISVILIINIFEDINTNILSSFLIILAICLFLSEIVISIYNYSLYGIKIYNGKLKCLKNTIITNTSEIEINELIEYLENKKQNNDNVLMINKASVFNYLYFNESNGIYDLPFVGNVGTITEEEIINNVKNMHDTYILLLKEENMHYQEFKGLNDFIKNNYSKVDEILTFEVYLIE